MNIHMNKRATFEMRQYICGKSGFDAGTASSKQIQYYLHLHMNCHNERFIFFSCVGIHNLCIKVF